MEARIATGYLCHWIYEYNSRDAVGQWTNILNDITDTTADVFMGVGLQCARCHDHKFDPILQKDYYRLQAFLATTDEKDVSLATPEEEADYKSKTESLQAQIVPLKKRLKTAQGQDTAVDLALFSWEPVSDARAFQRSAELTRRIGNRWGGVCEPPAPPAGVLWTFKNQPIGPAGQWTLKGTAFPDPPVVPVPIDVAPGIPVPAPPSAGAGSGSGG